MSDLAAVLDKKAGLEDELIRTERQIYELEGEYLQVHPAHRFVPCYLTPGDRRRRR